MEEADFDFLREDVARELRQMNDLQVMMMALSRLLTIYALTDTNAAANGRAMMLDVLHLELDRRIHKGHG